MFIPRAVRLKGVKEARPGGLPKPAPSEKPQVISEDALLVDAMEGITTNSPETQTDDKTSAPIARGSKFATAAITPDYMAQVAAGIDLIFSDYALHEQERSKWLQSRYRTVDGEGNFVHLAALLEHPYVYSIKPVATQIRLLQQVLQTHRSEYLELSPNGYYIRRKPSSYPPRFLPHNSFEVVDDDGLSFWDQRTIYVEPHLRTLCQTPGRLAHWLQQHGQLKPKWLPIQAVHMLWNSCAFVVLSASVMHEDVWSKWRALEKPENWKIMTKVEHTKRTLEYVQLLKKENPRGMRKDPVNESELPPIARLAALPANCEMVQNPEEPEAQPRAQPKAKRKRNRRKGDKSSAQAEGIEDMSVDAGQGTINATEEAEDEPIRKRRG